MKDSITQQMVYIGLSKEDRNLNGVITKYKFTIGKVYDVLVTESDYWSTWHVLTDDGFNYNIGKAMGLVYFKPLSEFRDNKLIELGIV